MIELFEHNKTAYEAVLEQLEETGKACVIHPTGTGKSFIAFKWAEDNPDKRFVWVSPSENIFDTQLENVKRASGFEPGNIVALTYARLANMTDEEIRALDADSICLDEMHRAGAKVWNTGVERLIAAHPNARLLGLTATPVRYLDNQRDMSEELFDGCVADSITLGEAIARGILPAPKYVVSLYTYNMDGELHKYRDRICRSSAASREKAEEYLEKLRRALEKAEGLDVVFAKHLTRGKYIAFCANVEHMGEMLKKAPEWFDGVDRQPHIYSVWADSPSAKADYAAFRADESDHLRLMFCVDMFNEGIHVDDIDGVILFRPTISPIVFKQQIGRALSTVKGGTPLIIDAVNNFENLYSISSIQSEMLEIVNFYRNSRREDEIEADTFQIIDEVRECRQLINQLEETLSLSWELMYREAKAYFEAHGNLDMPSLYKTPEGIPLGRWISTQRNVYNGNSAGLLDERRIQLLNEIGMVWDYAKAAAWEDGFTHLQAYKAEHGNADVAAQHVCADGFALGRWVCNQRVRYMKLRNAGMEPLDDERIRQLEALGMIWKKADSAFEEGYLEATRYAAAHGDLEVPTRYICANGFKLGAWIGRMRLRYKGYGDTAPLTEDQIKRLEEIGMRWQNKADQQWDHCLAEAGAFYRENGHLRVPGDYCRNGIRLGRWVLRQRADYKKGKLTENQLEQLMAVGFSIECRNKSWDRNYTEAQAYYTAQDNLEVPPDYVAPNGTWLGKWVSEQRKAHQKGTLPAEKKAKLDAIGMRWENANMLRWCDNLEAVGRYPSMLNGVPIVPEDAVSEYGTKLISWTEKQYKRYSQGQLKPEQRKLWEKMLQSS